jgi:hypothetical protein
MADDKLTEAADNAASAAAMLREARLAQAFHYDAYNRATDLVNAATRDVSASNLALIKVAGGATE